MTKFICISDSHVGVDQEKYNTVNYHIQKGYHDHDEEIVNSLSRLIESESIDFVVHSGDIIDSASVEQIQSVHKLFAALPVPLYLCLGNHDLDDSDAQLWWLEHAPSFFPNNQINYSLNCDDCVIHMVPNQWGDEAYTWTTTQKATFLDEQLTFLNTALEQRPDVFHFVVTHSPVFGIDQEQVGPGMGTHAADEGFIQCFETLCKRHPHLRVVVGGHTHHNMYVSDYNCHFVTTSAFLEAPFDCKMFTINNEEQLIDMCTRSLASDVPFPVEYDYDKTQSQGRLWDRSFIEKDGQFIKK